MSNIDVFANQKVLNDIDFIVMRELQNGSSYREVAAQIGKSLPFIQQKVNWLIEKGFVIKQQGIKHRGILLSQKGKEALSNGIKSKD